MHRRKPVDKFRGSLFIVTYVYARLALSLGPSCSAALHAGGISDRCCSAEEK